MKNLKAENKGSITEADQVSPSQTPAKEENYLQKE